MFLRLQDLIRGASATLKLRNFNEWSLKEEWEKEEDTTIYEIVGISKNSITLYDEKERLRIHFTRIGTSSGDGESVSLPSWLPSEVMQAFGMEGKLTTKSEEYLKEHLPEEIGLYLGEEIGCTGTFDSSPITVEMNIDADGSVNGKYGYDSTLERTGYDDYKSWFRIRGLLLFSTDDNDSDTYMLLQTQHPENDRVFEYALMKYNMSDGTWKGEIFNVKYLNDPSNVKMHKLQISYMPEYDSWMEDEYEEADSAVVADSTR